MGDSAALIAEFGHVPSLILSDSKILGEGTFGVVISAKSKLTKETMAVKRVKGYHDDEPAAQYTLRELRLMKLLRPHPNIIRLLDLYISEERNELYFMMELMDCDLGFVIKSQQVISESHIRSFTYQLLEGVRAMHSVGVIHRDLKPGNLLVNKNCHLRVADFGLARYVDSKSFSQESNYDDEPMTEYVVTRYYRPPCLLLAPERRYTNAVDLWSVGCIVAELVKRKTLFRGKTPGRQVQLIFQQIGYSDLSELGFPIGEKSREFLDMHCKSAPHDLREALPTASVSCLELIRCLLTVNPQRRASAKEALTFSFFKDVMLPQTLDYSKFTLKKAHTAYFAFDKGKPSLSSLVAMLVAEVAAGASFATANATAQSPSISETIQDRTLPRLQQHEQHQVHSPVEQNPSQVLQKITSHEQQQIRQPSSSGQKHATPVPMSKVAPFADASSSSSMTQRSNVKSSTHSVGSPYTPPREGTMTASPVPKVTFSSTVTFAAPPTSHSSGILPSTLSQSKISKPAEDPAMFWLFNQFLAAETAAVAPITPTPAAPAPHKINKDTQQMQTQLVINLADGPSNMDAAEDMERNNAMARTMMEALAVQSSNRNANTKSAVPPLKLNMDTVAVKASGRAATISVVSASTKEVVAMAGVTPSARLGGSAISLPKIGQSLSNAWKAITPRGGVFGVNISAPAASILPEPAGLIADATPQSSDNRDSNVTAHKSSTAKSYFTAAAPKNVRPSLIRGFRR